MRTLTTAQTRMLAATERSLRLKVEIDTAGGTLVDFTALLGYDWVIGVECGESIDDPGQTATVYLRRDVYYDSLNPMMASTRLATSINVGRRIVISVALVPMDTTPAGGDWIEIFRGGIDSISAASEPMTLECSDQIRVLRDTWIEAPATYGTTPGAVEGIMQDILDDNMASPPTIYVPTSPGWVIEEFQTEVQSLLTQLTMLADQIGWNLRYRWDSGTSAYRLTLYEPDRSNTTPDYAFSASTIFDWQNLDISIEDIRNVVDVTYGDRGTLDCNGQPTPQTESASDSSSITAYGRRWMGITLAASSQITTSTEAQAMAAACLSDLKEPLAGVGIEVQFFPFVELHDLYTLTADGYHLDVDTEFAVVGYRHTLTEGKCRTAIMLRGETPAGAHKRWLGMAAFPGVASLQDVLPPPPVALSVVESIGHLQAYVPEQWLASSVEFHVVPPGGTVDVGAASTTVVTVTDAYAREKIVADLTNLPIGELVDVVAIPIDRRGNRGSHQRTSNQRTARFGTHFLDPIQRIAGSFMGSTFDKQSRGPLYPPDGWHMAVGAWNTDAKKDDGSLGVDPQTGLYNLYLDATTVATELYSDAFPVTTGRRYLASAVLYVDSATCSVSFKVEWLDDTLSVLATTNIHTGVAPVASAWFQAFLTVAPPVGARRARMRILKDTTAAFVQVDRVVWEESVQRQTEFTGISLVDDFCGGNMVDRFGDLGWNLTYIGADPASVDDAVAELKPQSSWTEIGVLRLGTPLASGSPLSNYGTVLYLGEIDASLGPFTGPPPVGVECRMKANVTTITSVNAWGGLWSNVTTYPGGASISGIGWKMKDDSGTLRWWGLCSDAGTETTTVAALSDAGDFVELGWRRTATGVMFMVNGADAEEVTTNLPDVACLLAPVIGVRASSAAERWILVDWFRLEGQYRRMPL